MTEQQFENVVKNWQDHILVENLQDYKLEIGKDVPKEYAAIALFLDSRTVRAAGETEAHYEGYRNAATDILNLLGVELIQHDEEKLILINKKASGHDKQERLKEHIWG